MADIKISALPAALSLTATDIMPVVNSATTKQATTAQVVTGGLSGGTANGLVYLNGSKTPTSSSAVTYDGNSVVISVSNSSDALRITQTGSGNALVVEDSANPDSTPFVINSNGNIGIGATPAASAKFQIGGALNLAATSFGARLTSTIDPSVVNTEFGSFVSIPTVSAGTLPDMEHFSASQGTFTGTVTRQYGFYAASALIGATNNYGFYSNIASGTGRWNFYANGTAANYFAGRVGIGDATDIGALLFINLSVTGSSGDGYGIKQHNSVLSSVTGTFAQYHSSLFTQAASFTLGAYKHFQAAQQSIGVGSTVTTQYGFIAESGMVGATNNYGFYSNIPSGTGRWNFYANGTAANYFAGDMQLGKTVTATGTTGAQTINKTIGSVNFAAAATSLVVTNNLVTTSSIIIATVAANDSTMKSVSVVAGAGSFTIYANAAATAETRVNFQVFN